VHLFDIEESADLCLEVSRFCFEHGYGALIFDSCFPHDRYGTFDTFWGLNDSRASTCYCLRDDIEFVSERSLLKS
jgi:hypothetical protein